MSRAEHTDTTRRRVLAGLVPSALALGLAGVLVGCGAGQVTQTDSQLSDVNGASATVGAMAIRDAQLAYPAGGVYQPGGTAMLIVTIVNTGLSADTLLRVTSPAAGSVTVDGSDSGSKDIPGGFAVHSGTDPDDMTAQASGQGSSVTATPNETSGAPSSSPSGSALPTGPSAGSSASAAPASASSAPALPPAKIAIVLTGLKSINGGSLRAGLTIPITFYFAHAGQVTVTEVPIAAPSDGQAAVQASASASNG